MPKIAQSSTRSFGPTARTYFFFTRCGASGGLAAGTCLPGMDEESFMCLLQNREYLGKDVSRTARGVSKRVSETMATRLRTKRVASGDSPRRESNKPARSRLAARRFEQSVER